MLSLTLDEEALTVSASGTTIGLLPKEFALFRFLYLHKNQTFTRAQLLDEVWPLEDPVDRTVDDHIYRLRKKVKPFAQGITLDTIRGVGYRLTVIETKPSALPSSQDEDVRETYHKLMRKFHLFGQGDALQTLAFQQETLGLPADSFYTVFARIAKGDLTALFDEKYPLSDRMGLMVGTYGYLHPDPAHAFQIVKLCLQHHLLSEKAAFEAERHDLVFYYLAIGDVQEADRRLRETRQIVDDENMVGFRLVVRNSSIYLGLFTGETDAEMARRMQESAALLEEQPFLRERGMFAVLHGLYLLRQDVRAGRQRIREGMDILVQSRFVPAQWLAVYFIRFYLNKTKQHPDLLREYDAVWAEFDKQYEFGKRVQEIEVRLLAMLKQAGLRRSDSFFL